MYCEQNGRLCVYLRYGYDIKIGERKGKKGVHCYKHGVIETKDLDNYICIDFIPCKLKRGRKHKYEEGQSRTGRYVS
jgi:hypothetical protein